MQKKIIIAIDGYSSCGKSSFAKLIAAKLGYVFIDTGAMYRAVTYYALQNGVFCGETIDEERLILLLDKINLSFIFNPDLGKSEVYLTGVNIEEQIRTMEVSDRVSRISSLAFVRSFLVAKQQGMGHNKGVVMDGRDIGTVVFPDAELKIFMTASVEVRAQRRYKELTEKGHPVSLEQIRQNIEERDRIDTTRDVAPLRKADDALLLDNSCMTLEQQMEWVLVVIAERLGEKKGG